VRLKDVITCNMWVPTLNCRWRLLGGRCNNDESLALHAVYSDAMQGSYKRKAAAHAGREDATNQSPIATKRPRSTVVQLIDRKQADIGRQHAATPTAAATESDENLNRAKNHGKLRVSMPPRKTGARALTRNRAKEVILITNVNLWFILKGVYSRLQLHACAATCGIYIAYKRLVSLSIDIVVDAYLTW